MDFFPVNWDPAELVMFFTEIARLDIPRQKKPAALSGMYDDSDPPTKYTVPKTIQQSHLSPQEV